MPCTPLLLGCPLFMYSTYILMNDCLLYIAKLLLGGGLPDFFYLCLLDQSLGEGVVGVECIPNTPDSGE